MGRLQVGHRRGPRPCPGRHRVVVGPEGWRRPDLDPGQLPPRRAHHQRSVPGVDRPDAGPLRLPRDCVRELERDPLVGLQRRLRVRGLAVVLRGPTHVAQHRRARCRVPQRRRHGLHRRVVLRTLAHRRGGPVHRPGRRLLEEQDLDSGDFGPSTPVGPTTTVPATTDGATDHADDNRGTDDPTDHTTDHHRPATDHPTDNATDHPPQPCHPRHHRQRHRPGHPPQPTNDHVRRARRSPRRSPATPACERSAGACSIATSTSTASRRVRWHLEGRSRRGCSIPRPPRHQRTLQWTRTRRWHNVSRPRSTTAPTT